MNSLVCPRCDRVLEYSAEPPLFCSWCGQRLPHTQSAALPTSATADFQPQPHDSTDQLEQTQSLPPTSMPTQVGGYRILRLLGSGGMGTVYEAEDPHFHRQVAIKILSNQFTTSATSLERFRQEGKLASQIAHPHCVFVYAADTEQGRPYIVMERMPGTTLKDRVEQQGPLPPQEAVHLILDVIAGLREAHRLGVIHRDVKPSNCFLTADGQVKVGDFGLSRSLGTKKNLTQSGAFLGTILYASPEQIRGERVDYASDVYSVAGTLYYLLTGQAPFEHDSATAALARIISEDPPKPRSLRPEIPRSLEKVVLTGLQRDRSRRYRNLDELREALVALVPSHLSFGGLWIRVGAYLIDFLLINLLVWLLFGSRVASTAWGGYLFVLVLAVYFVLSEGLTGTSLGKRLLRLRVCRAGSTDPPGLLRAGVRTLIFFLLILVTLKQPGILITQLEEDGFGPHLLEAVLPFLVGLLVLIVPMRRRNDYRGLHEWLSGTCVMKLPPRARPVRLDSRLPNPLETLPRPSGDLPAQVGAYSIRAATPANAAGERILLGEDPLLGRRLLIWIGPAEVPRLESPRMDVSRPSRARALARGQLEFAARCYCWHAFVAPTGSPLKDVIASQGRLDWKTAAPLLKSLAAELATAEQEGNLPNQLTLDQVWIEPTGELMLLDFPLNLNHTPKHTAQHSLGFLVAVTTLVLEGTPRKTTGPGDWVRTPLPRPARRIVNRLLVQPESYSGPHAVHTELKQLHASPSEVTFGTRLTQFGLQSLIRSVGLAMMLSLWLLGGIIEFGVRDAYCQQADRMLAILDDSVARSRLQASDALDPNDAQLRGQIKLQQQRDKLRRRKLEQSLKPPERKFAKDFSAFMVEDLTGEDPGSDQQTFVKVAHRAQRGYNEDDFWVVRLRPILPEFWMQTVALLWVWPVIWAMGAYVFRGGLSMQLTGIEIVRTDGRKATRRRCTLRSLLLWTPFAGLLSASIFVQATFPQYVQLRLLLFWAAALLLPLYLVLGLLFPQRPPHDRLLGTHLVPG